MVGGVYKDKAQAMAESAALVEIVPSAAKQVGSVVRARRGLGSATGFVLRFWNGQVEIVWPNGEIALCPLGRIKENVAFPGDEVRSFPGRLMWILASKSVEAYRTESSAATVRARVDELMKSRGHAIGLLLDRGPLSLSMADCFALPIEPWRVRYEFLASAAASSGDEALRLASEILADRSAPIGVRMVVALKFSLPVDELGADANIVFGGRPELCDYSVLSAAAVRLSHSLGAAGVVRGTPFLRTAVTDPFPLAPHLKSAAVLAALERPFQPDGHLAVGLRTPLSVVDDLIDRGVPIEIRSGERDTPVDSRGVTLAAYVQARTDPAQLNSEDVIGLRFGAEAVRRYLAGATEVEHVLPPESVGDVKELRAVITGSGPVGSATNPLVQELRDVLGSNGRLTPSEKLLADRSVWRALIDASITGSASTGQLGVEFAGLSALTRAAAALFEWRWDEAWSIARDGLREAREEVRAELLNIMACALWLQGDPEPALAALDGAREGVYSDALLVNASVIATEMEHHSAVERLVKLAREAPSAHQRAVAAERALILWTNDDDRIWEEDEDDDSLPTEIRDALRPLIRERLPEDRYMRILRVLANRDDEWLAAQPDSAFGPNAGRAAVGIFKARATGINEFIEILATELRNGNSEEWLAQERDSVVDAAINVLSERNDELSAAFFGLTLIDAKLPMRAEQRVPLKCLTVASITSNVDPDDSEPNLRFIDLVAEAHRELVGVHPDDRELLTGLVGNAAERLAHAYCVSRYRQFDDVIDAYNTMMGMVREIPSRNLNKQAVREAFEPISEFCRDTYDIFNRLRPLIDDKKLDERVVAMMSQASDMGHRIAAVTL
jgi:hypothetical protein